MVKKKMYELKAKFWCQKMFQKALMNWWCFHMEAWIKQEACQLEADTWNS
jgi:hypothetical protein